MTADFNDIYGSNKIILFIFQICSSVIYKKMMSIDSIG
jgi:hypothetical protein